MIGIILLFFQIVWVVQLVTDLHWCNKPLSRLVKNVYSWSHVGVLARDIPHKIVVIAEEKDSKRQKSGILVHMVVTESCIEQN